MSNEINANEPQPPPIPQPNREAAWALVIADATSGGLAATSGGLAERVLSDMIKRHVFGVSKYGTALKAGDGRNHLIDAYQEALDLCVYLRQEIDERGINLGKLIATDQVQSSTRGDDSDVVALYLSTLGATIPTLRALIDAAATAT